MMLPEYTVKCGGHAAAAGLTIQKADFDAFKDAFTKLCHDRNDISKNNVSPPLDAIVDSSELNEEFVRYQPSNLLVKDSLNLSSD